MAFFYSNIAGPQRDGFNLPDAGASLIAAPTGAGFNDPVLELGTLSMPTITYTMTGAEAQNDIIYLARVGMGTIVDPVNSNVAGNGVGTTAAVQVGDTDTVGATVGINQTRYSTALNVATDMTTTTGLPFAGGAALITPAETTDDPVWLTAKFSTLTVPVAGKVLIFRIKLTDNR